MRIIAQVRKSQGKNEVILQTNDNVHSLTIPPKSTGLGSSANGGELLFLASATCHCNDIYREAAHRGVTIVKVEVTVEGDFGGEGEPATNITYNELVKAEAKESDIKELMKHADRPLSLECDAEKRTPMNSEEAKARLVPLRWDKAGFERNQPTWRQQLSSLNDTV
jgi:organic hydroperoxide reductase OsmC/OhrA